MSNNVENLNVISYRKLFPITKQSIYFNHASTGPMSLPARKAIEDCLEVYSSQAEFETKQYFSRLKSARATVARLIKAMPEEIVFTHNTSEGIYVALINLPLRQDDKILVMDEVFPAVRYIVNHNLPHLGKKFVRFSGQNAVEVIKRHIDKKVKAVVIDYVQFLSGEMIDLNDLSEFLNERDIYLIVDGIQAIGAVNFDVKKTRVDFLACGAAKWLFGPSGAGFLYINKDCHKNMKNLHTGWLGADWLDFTNLEREPPLFEDARKYEQGTRNIIGISAFVENIKILLQYGLGRVEGQILALKSALRGYFKALNYEILTPERGPQSGIITARPRKGAKTLFNILEENKIIISLRNNWLRFSPHFYNTTDEVEKIYDVLLNFKEK